MIRKNLPSYNQHPQTCTSSAMRFPNMLTRVVNSFRWSVKIIMRQNKAVALFRVILYCWWQICFKDYYSTKTYRTQLSGKYSRNCYGSGLLLPHSCGWVEVTMGIRNEQLQVDSHIQSKYAVYHMRWMFKVTTFIETFHN